MHPVPSLVRFETPMAQQGSDEDRIQFRRLVLLNVGFKISRYWSVHAPRKAISETASPNQPRHQREVSIGQGGSQQWQQIQEDRGLTWGP
jgi:hypothetical protein